jgi:glycosyltransferase involved in cell wall biosynthesis
VSEVTRIAPDPASIKHKRIHVLVLIDGLGWGGAEMLLPEFVRAAALAEIDVSIAYLREKDGSPAARRIRDLGVGPVGLEVGGLVNPASFRRVYKHIAAVGPDLVHTHLGYSDWLGGLAAGTLGVPTISTIHVTRWDDTPRERVKLRFFDLARRGAASRVLAVSEAARASYMRQGFGPGDRLIAMHNGISGDARPGAGRRVRAELGIAPEEQVVGMVSVLRRGKGHAIAADAIAKVLQRRPRTRLVVVGDGPFRDDVERSLASLGNAALLTGHRDDVMAVLDSFDVFLLPSEHEAFPTALLEAMAAGLPIVASAVGGVPEIVLDGITGRLLTAPMSAEDVAAALLDLLESPAERTAMGDAGSRRFEAEFSLERWAERLRSLYDDVIGEQATPCQRFARWASRAARQTGVRIPGPERGYTVSADDAHGAATGRQYGQRPDLRNLNADR